MGKCKGKNCGAIDGLNHSEECLAEYEKAVSGGLGVIAQPPLTPQEQWGVPPGHNTIRFLVKHICHHWANLTKVLP